METLSDFGVVRPWDALAAARIVDEDEHCLIGIVPEISVGVVSREEVDGLAVVNHALALSPLEELSGKVVQLSYLTCRYGLAVCSCQCCLTSVFCEPVFLVAVPSAREVYAQSAVSLALVFRYEHHLVTCENLRETAHGSHHGHHDFHSVRVLSYDVSDSVGIMVSRENHHLGKVMIYEIV